MLYGVLAIVIWMSARNARLTEQSRRAALEELDRFFDDSSDLLATATAGGYFVRINPAWTTALGYDVAELRPSIIDLSTRPTSRRRTTSHRQVGAGQTVVNFRTVSDIGTVRIGG
jgi:PAS domain-containing protein